jgi:glycosyltransferase involved in cell wall biosynthesis
MSRALANAGAKIVALHGYYRVTPFTGLIKKAWARFVLRSYYEIGRNPQVLRSYARQIERRAETTKVDAIFATGTHLTADCRPRCPIFFWADATVPSLFKTYPGYEKFAAFSYQEALAAEKRAVANATAIFFSSDWAANSAINDLGCPPEKVRVVPFGANFLNEPSSQAALDSVAVRSRQKLVLLFAGVDWQRKGGRKALAIVEAAALRCQVDLHILGVSAIPGEPAKQEVSSSCNVVWHGRISKTTSEGRLRIERLFAEAHFLLLPTIADCTPMVFSEANAWAVPVATHRVGGIPTMIAHGENGRMFDVACSPAEIADWLVTTWQNESLYRHLARSSRGTYDRRLNWRVAAIEVMRSIRTHLDEKVIPTGGST